MKPIRIIKVILNIVMYVFFVILMGYHLTSREVHEYLGVAIFMCFIFHNALNYRWYKTLFKGRYTMNRSFQTAVNFLFLFSFIACLLSVMMISGVVFRNIRIPDMMMFGRKLHMISTAWCFVFMSVHLGLHIHTPRTSKQAKTFFYVIMLLASVYGIYQFIIRRFYEELFLLTEFKWFDYEKNTLQYLFETVCISLAFVMVTHLIKQLGYLRKEKRRNAKKK